MRISLTALALFGSREGEQPARRVLSRGLWLQRRRGGRCGRRRRGPSGPGWPAHRGAGTAADGPTNVGSAAHGPTGGAHPGAGVKWLLPGWFRLLLLRGELGRRQRQRGRENYAKGFLDYYPTECSLGILF